jgi:hypothetical protein
MSKSYVFFVIIKPTSTSILVHIHCFVVYFQKIANMNSYVYIKSFTIARRAICFLLSN